MSGPTGLLIKLGVRLVVFGLVFWFAARKSKKIVISSRWVLPVIALLFAALNTILYWALTPILDLATLGAVSIAVPFAVNLGLLALTLRIVQAKKWLVIEGFLATLWMAIALTVAHGALWVALDYLPKHV